MNNKTDEPLFTILKGTNQNMFQTATTPTLQQTYVFTGSPQGGKSTMISSIQGQGLPNQSVGLLYSFLRSNVAGHRSIIQLYEVSGQAFKHLQTLPITKINYSQVSYLIVVDLADNPSEILNQLNSQINELRSSQEKLMQNILSPQQYQELEQRSYTSIQHNPDRVKIRPTLLPLVIVGWKYDQYAKNLDVEVRKWLSRGLRYLAHLNNATLVFGSQNDCSLVKQAIQNQSSKVNQTDYMKMIYVSGGVDSVEQIGLPQMSTQQISPIDAISKIIKEQVVVNPNPQKKAPKRNITQEEWDQHKELRIDRIKKEKDRQQEKDKDN